MRTILGGAARVARRDWPGLLLVALVFGLMALAIVPHDRFWLIALHGWPVTRERWVIGTARFLSMWGDYPTYNVPVAVLMWLGGYFGKSPVWRRLGVVFFLGGTLGGLVDDCGRFTLGRPRPDAMLPDGFYGMPAAWQARFESFPSGHAASVFGSAVALVLIRPGPGLLALFYAFLVAWSRMELHHHFPSDILVGSVVGITMGWLVGQGAKERGRPLPHRSRPAET
jgi:membrane-associated phospholipid phosphatase